jgi:hypothetical protein
VVLDDFLTYVENWFPSLGPFRSLGLCAGNTERINRRLRQILSDASGQDADSNYYGPFVAMGDGQAIASRWFLRHAGPLDEIELIVYPADTLTQARNFYSRPQALAGLRELRNRPGWTAGPNFHFGHTQRGFCWTTTKRDLDEYVELWTQRFAEGVNAVPRSDWPKFWAWLEAEQIATPADMPEFDAAFAQTGRQTASPRPGVWVARRWPMDEAIALNGAGGVGAVGGAGGGANGASGGGGAGGAVGGRGVGVAARLAGAVREELNAALVAFGEKPLAVAGNPARMP